MKNFEKHWARPIWNPIQRCKDKKWFGN